MNSSILKVLHHAPVLAAMLAGRLFGLCGCAGNYAPREKLAFALQSFNSGVRWQRHQEASGWMVGKLKNQYMDKVEELDEDLKVSEVEMLRVTFRKKGKLAVVRYRYRWHTTKEMLLRKAVIVQFWKWKKTAWVLFRVKQASGPPFPYFQRPTNQPRPRPGPRPAAAHAPRSAES